MTLLPVQAPEAESLVACLLCHTPGPLSAGSIRAGGYWTCRRCGMTWTADRLETATAYAYAQSLERHESPALVPVSTM